MANLQALKSELDAGHPDTGAYDADDGTAADQLNAENRSRIIPVTSAELLAWSAGASTGQDPRLRKVREAAADTAAARRQFRAISEVAEIMLTRDGVVLDLNQPDRAAFVDALVAGNVLSAEDKTSLYELATETVSRAEELGLGRVRAGTVAQARAL